MTFDTMAQAKSAGWTVLLWDSAGLKEAFDPYTGLTVPLDKREWIKIKGRQVPAARL